MQGIVLCSSSLFIFFTQELALGVVIECEYYLFGKGKSKLEEAICMGLPPPPLKSPFFLLTYSSYSFLSSFVVGKEAMKTGVGFFNKKSK